MKINIQNKQMATTSLLDESEYKNEKNEWSNLFDRYRLVIDKYCPVGHPLREQELKLVDEKEQWTMNKLKEMYGV